jgi:transposase
MRACIINLLKRPRCVMSKKRKTYTEEFKRGAVEHVESTGKPLAQVARELDVPSNNLTVWMQKYGSKAEPKVQTTLLVDYERLKKLEQQNRELAEENEILKKAMHFFTKNRS